MSDRFPICTATYTRYDLLARSIKSFADEEDPAFKVEFHIIDNGGFFQESGFWDEIKDHPNLPPIHVTTPKYNLGVGRSCNNFVRNIGRCIIINDDVVTTTKDLLVMKDCGDDNPDTIVITHDDPIDAFTIFMVNRPKAWVQLGGFDEVFYPAYYEDNDLRYRLKLANNPIVTVKIENWKHDRSSTLGGFTEREKRNHWGNFDALGLYYIQKWGGKPGEETYTEPFEYVYDCSLDQ